MQKIERDECSTRNGPAEAENEKWLESSGFNKQRFTVVLMGSSQNSRELDVWLQFTRSLSEIGCRERFSHSLHLSELIYHVAFLLSTYDHLQYINYHSSIIRAEVCCTSHKPQICCFFILRPEENCTVQQHHTLFLVSFKSLNSYTVHLRTPSEHHIILPGNTTEKYPISSRLILYHSTPHRAPWSARVSWSVTQKLRSKVNAINRDSEVKSFINISSGQQGQMHLHNPKDKWIRFPRHMQFRVQSASSHINIGFRP